MASAEIESATPSAARFLFIARSNALRIPVTSIISISAMGVGATVLFETTNFAALSLLYCAISLFDLKLGSIRIDNCPLSLISVFSPVSLSNRLSASIIE